MLVKFLALAPLAWGAMFGGSPVKVMDHQQLQKHLNQKTEHTSVIMFYADWCGHCQSFAPQYIKAAQAIQGAMPGAVHFLAVEDQAAMGAMGIQGFPTVKIHSGGSLHEYNGRDAPSLAKQVMNLLNQRVTAQLGGPKKKAKPSKDALIDLTAATFDSMLMKSEQGWFVMFHAPWCGHCKNAMPAVRELAQVMAGKFKVATVDATVEQELASRFNVRGYPTMKVFPPGAKSVSSAIPYQGGRDLESMQNFVSQHMRISLEWTQLRSASIYQEACQTDGRTICVVLFVPHILDSSEKERKDLLKLVQTAAESVSSATVDLKLLWSQGGDQFDMEEKLNLKFGYPALIFMHEQKKKYAIHKGTMEMDVVKSFLRTAVGGTPRKEINDIPASLEKVIKALKVSEERTEL